MREHMEKLAVLQTLDMKIRGMQREKDEIPSRLAALEEEFKKEEEKVQGQKAETRSPAKRPAAKGEGTRGRGGAGEKDRGPGF